MNCRNRRAVKIDGKLNPKALKEADHEVPSCSNHSERKQWMDAYIRAGGQWECADPSGKTPRTIEEKCPFGDLYVKVTSDDGIGAIADALVEIPTLGQQVTALGGEASWLKVQPGTYAIQVTKDGYAPHPSISNATVNKGKATYHSVTLQKNICRVQVGAIKVTLGQYHLFVAYSEGDRLVVYRGGPERNNPYQDQVNAGRATMFSPPGKRPNFWGRIVTIRMEGVEGNYDYQTMLQEGGANIVTIAEGPDYCGLDKKLTDVIRRIAASGTDYSLPPDGCNSNSVVRTILHEAGLPEKKPNLSTPLWQNRIPLP